MGKNGQKIYRLDPQKMRKVSISWCRDGTSKLSGHELGRTKKWCTSNYTIERKQKPIQPNKGVLNYFRGPKSEDLSSPNETLRPH